MREHARSTVQEDEDEEQTESLVPFRASHRTAASRQTMISLTLTLTRTRGAIKNYQYSSQNSKNRLSTSLNNSLTDSLTD